MKKFKNFGALATCLTLFFGGSLLAQPINMGNSPISFGIGCNNSYIRSTGTSPQRLQFGYHQGCVGPAYDQDQIYMDMANGRLGIGVGTPSYQLQLSSNSAGKPGSSTWTIVSDKRLKQGVNNFSDGLATVRGINPVTFHYSPASGYDTKPEYVGVLAQDLQQVAPYMVKEAELVDATGKATDYLTVDLGAMDFVLVNAVKELDAELQAQKAENEALRNMVEEIHAELAALKASPATGTPAIQLAPNPAGDQTTLRLSLPKGTQSAEVQFVAMNGQVYAVQHVDPNLQTPLIVHTAGFPKAQYTVRLMADGKTVAATRLVVQ